MDQLGTRGTDLWTIISTTDDAEKLKQIINTTQLKINTLVWMLKGPKMPN